LVLLHSTNGISFVNIGVVQAGGNRNKPSNYSYLHTSPVSGINFYRLLQKDQDDKGTLSAVTKVTIAKDLRRITVLGNPVTTDQLKICLSEQMDITLYNTLGKLIWKKRFSEGTQVIDVSGYGKGMYILKCEDYTEKILIQ
jgi:Secretion system C-terminal sorting domain